MSDEDEQTIRLDKEDAVDTIAAPMPRMSSAPPPPASSALLAPPSVRARPSAPPSAAPSAAPSASASLGSPGAAATSATMTAMHSEEAARARTFGRVTAILCVGALFAQIPYERNHAIRVATSIAYLALGGSGLWVAHRARDASTYTRTVFRVFAVVAVLAATVMIQYFGVFSAISAVVVLGSTFFSLGEDRVFGIGAAVAIAIAHGVSALLVTLGVAPDVGIFPSGDSPAIARIAAGVLVIFMYGMLIYQSRKNRNALEEAIERSLREARIARDREAQLEEAKENLDVALRVASGGGRYTGSRFGRFMLEEIIGRGAMGDVYAARDDNGNRAAVKLIHGGAFADPDIAARFAREAEIATRIAGPNLVDVREVGASKDGSPFIAMELLIGEDLAEVLRKRPTVTLAEARDIALDVSQGLAVLHAEGIVHRDLKPSNLFHAEYKDHRSSWKILDFGVSKIRASHGTLTEGRLVGTPGYMSPEQAQGRTCDASADIFSLGAVLYRALTGRRPFAGSDVPQTLFHVVYVQPPRPRDMVADLPRDVESVLAIALAKRPGDRFASAEELARAFISATKGKLAEAYRGRAQRVLVDLPWGAGLVDEAPPAAPPT